jgi:hypothetical protein
MSLNTDYHTLISRGRKAGLGTRELYLAMSTRPSEGNDALGRADTNGYIASINAQGQRVFRPLTHRGEP